MLRYQTLGLLRSTLLTACLPPTPPATTTLTPTPTLLTSTPVEAPPKPVMLEPQGFVQRIHSPVVAAKNHRYYAFSTGSRIPFISGWKYGNIPRRRLAFVDERESFP